MSSQYQEDLQAFWDNVNWSKSNSQIARELDAFRIEKLTTIPDISSELAKRISDYIWGEARFQWTTGM